MRLFPEIMDPEVNPLKDLAPAQRYQIMVYLSMMWTVIFCASTGAWFWIGELVLAHVFVALGALVTGATFYSARRKRIYRDYPVKDGTARYDDVWGG